MEKKELNTPVGQNVFVLRIYQIVDLDELQDKCKVFEDVNDALAEMVLFVEDARKFVKKEDWITETDEPMRFEAYCDGYYTSDHILARIDETQFISKRKQVSNN